MITLDELLSRFPDFNETKKAILYYTRQIEKFQQQRDRCIIKLAQRLEWEKKNESN